MAQTNRVSMRVDQKVWAYVMGSQKFWPYEALPLRSGERLAL